MKEAFLKTALTVLLTVILILPVKALASDSDGTETDYSQNELDDELERQLSLIDLSSFDEYFTSVGSFTGNGFGSVEELLKEYAENGSNETPVNLWKVLRTMFIGEFRSSFGTIAALVFAALLTALSGLVSMERLRPAVSFILCGSAVMLTVGTFSSLCLTARNAVGRTSDLSEKAMPILSSLLVSIGSSSTAGVFRPQLIFLSGTVIKAVENVILPLVLTGGILTILDALTNGTKLAELVKLITKSVKWSLGLLSVFYLGITAIQGLTMASRDGVSIRTAKYALDRLVPVVGGMVSGTVDSVMGCALLIKNGVGIVTVLILLAVILRPLIVLVSGLFVFRIAAAFSQPVADVRVVKLFSGIAEMTSYLFASVAVTGCMLALTLFVFIASGGITAGLW